MINARREGETAKIVARQVGRGGHVLQTVVGRGGVDLGLFRNGVGLMHRSGYRNARKAGDRTAGRQTSA